MWTPWYCIRFVKKLKHIWREAWSKRLGDGGLGAVAHIIELVKRNHFPRCLSHHCLSLTSYAVVMLNFNHPSAVSCSFLPPCHCSTSLCACTALPPWQVPSQWKRTINKHIPLHDLMNTAHILTVAFTAHDISNEQRSCVFLVPVIASKTDIASIWGGRICRDSETDDFPRVREKKESNWASQRLGLGTVWLVVPFMKTERNRESKLGHSRMGEWRLPPEKVSDASMLYLLESIRNVISFSFVIPPIAKNPKLFQRALSLWYLFGKDLWSGFYSHQECLDSSSS